MIYHIFSHKTIAIASTMHLQHVHKNNITTMKHVYSDVKSSLAKEVTMMIICDFCDSDEHASKFIPICRDW